MVGFLVTPDCHVIKDGLDVSRVHSRLYWEDDPMAVGRLVCSRWQNIRWMCDHAMLRWSTCQFLCELQCSDLSQKQQAFDEPVTQHTRILVPIGSWNDDKRPA